MSGSLYGEALVVEAGLGEADTELGLTGAGPPVGRLAGSSGHLGGHHGDPGAVEHDVELLHRFGGAEGDHRPLGDRCGLPVGDARERLAVGLGTAFDALGGEGDPGQLAQEVGTLAERCHRAHPVHHGPEPGGERGAGDAEGVVLGHHPSVALRAVVVGAGEGDRTEHGLEHLPAVRDVGGLMPGPAIDALAGVPGVDREELLEQ